MRNRMWRGLPRTEDHRRRTAQGDTQIGVALDDEERFEEWLVEVLGPPNQNATAA